MALVRPSANLIHRRRARRRSNGPDRRVRASARPRPLDWQRRVTLVFFLWFSCPGCQRSLPASGATSVAHGLSGTAAVPVQVGSPSASPMQGASESVPRAPTLASALLARIEREPRRGRVLRFASGAHVRRSARVVVGRPHGGRRLLADPVGVPGELPAGSPARPRPRDGGLRRPPLPLPRDGPQRRRRPSRDDRVDGRRHERRRRIPPGAHRRRACGVHRHPTGERSSRPVLRATTTPWRCGSPWSTGAGTSRVAADATHAGYER